MIVVVDAGHEGVRMRGLGLTPRAAELEGALSLSKLVPGGGMFTSSNEILRPPCMVTHAAQKLASRRRRRSDLTYNNIKQFDSVAPSNSNFSEVTMIRIPT